MRNRRLSTRPERLCGDGPSRLSHSKSRDTSRWRRGKPVEVLPGGQNLNTAIGLHAEKIIVAGENDLGVGLHGTLEDHVILWIAAHPVQGSRHCDMLSIAGVFLEDGKHFLILPGELAHQRGANLRNNLIADRNRVVVKHGVESGLRGAAELES